MGRLMSTTVQDKAAFKQFTGSFITRFRLASEPASPGPDIGAREMLDRLQKGAYLARNPWTRLAWMETENGAQLFAAGDVVECSVATAMELCANPEPELFSGAMDEKDMTAIVALVNGGHLVLASE